AAALGDRLREVREQHREPEPDADRADEPELARVAPREVEDEDARRDRAPELDDEHDGVPELQPWVELRERVADRVQHERAREDAARLPCHREAVSRSSERFSSSTFTPGS